MGSVTSKHGLLIVGWGDPVNSSVGINTNIGRNGFSVEGQPNKIPYVADFAYGYNPLTDNTGFLQDIRPRPFYSAIAPISNTQLMSQLTHLGNPGNAFVINQFSDYAARLRGDAWGAFRFPDGTSPNIRFFKFTDIEVTQLREGNRGDAPSKAEPLHE